MWQDRAKCGGQDTELFFPGKGSAKNRKTLKAKAICSSCPVQQECLQLALRNEQTAPRFGIYGGLTAAERVQLFGGVAEDEGSAA